VVIPHVLHGKPTAVLHQEHRGTDTTRRGVLVGLGLSFEYGGMGYRAIAMSANIRSVSKPRARKSSMIS